MILSDIGLRRFKQLRKKIGRYVTVECKEEGFKHSGGLCLISFDEDEGLIVGVGTRTECFRSYVTFTFEDGSVITF